MDKRVGNLRQWEPLSRKQSSMHHLAELRVENLRLSAWLRFRSLRWRLTALLGMTLLVTLITISASVLHFIDQNEQRTWENRQWEAARHAADTVSTLVHNTQQTLLLASLSERVSSETETNVLDNLLQHSPALLELIRLDSDGRVFDSAFVDAPLLANLFTVPQSRWFTESQSGRPYLGSVEISAQSDPYLIVALPAPDDGVVAARLQMTMLWELMSALRFGKTGQAYVIDQDGVIVAHTEPEVALAHIRVPETGTNNDQSSPSGQDRFDAYTNFQDVHVVGVTAPVAGTDWTVVTELAQVEAYATSRHALWLFGGGTVLFACLVMLVTGAFLRVLVFRPMEELQTGAVRIGQGDLDYQIKNVRQDEIGQVADAFNEMASRLGAREGELREQSFQLMAEVAERKHGELALQQAKAELEERVEERTRELKEANMLLNERQERLRAFTRALPDPAFVLDEDGHYIEVIATESDQPYASSDELRGRRIDQLFANGEAEEFLSTIRRTIETREPQTLQYRFDASEGPRWFEGRSAPMHTGNGDSPMVVWLARDITERKEAEEQIAASLREKEVMLKEIHHRVKNNLQVISSLLYLQAKDVEDEATIALFMDSQTRVRSMALVHERLYRSEDLSMVNFGEYIGNLAGYLFQAYNVDRGAIDLKTDVGKFFLGIDTAVPCGLIVNELVSNALKYAFPNGQKGEVSIDFSSCDEKTFSLVISDNGIGFPVDLDFRNTPSLGMQLVNTLVDQIEGTLEMDRSAGTRFSIRANLIT